jgi:hypothetical protein
MSFYGLSYSSKADNSGVELRLEPPIEVVCCYNALLDNKAMGTLNTNAKKFIHQLVRLIKFVINKILVNTKRARK